MRKPSWALNEEGIQFHRGQDGESTHYVKHKLREHKKLDFKMSEKLCK